MAPSISKFSDWGGNDIPAYCVGVYWTDLPDGSKGWCHVLSKASVAVKLTTEDILHSVNAREHALIMIGWINLVQHQISVPLNPFMNWYFSHSLCFVI